MKGDPDNPFAGIRKSYACAGGHKHVSRIRYGNIVLTEEQKRARDIIAGNPANTRSPNTRLVRARGFASLREAVPSNLTVMRADGTVIRQENHLPPR